MTYNVIKNHNAENQKNHAVHCISPFFIMYSLYTHIKNKSIVKCHISDMTFVMCYANVYIRGLTIALHCGEVPTGLYFT